MPDIQVHARTRSALDILSVNLSDVIAQPDIVAAFELNERMGALNIIHRIHERTYPETGIIAREFERRHLYRHLIDPDTGEAFPHFTAWASCSNFLACRSTIFEAKADMKALEDVPAERLLDVPKDNIKVLKQMSTKVRNQPDVLEAAKTMKANKLLRKIEAEHPDQHLESRKPMRFSPGRAAAEIVEEGIEYAIEHEIAGTRDEALVRAFETALEAWKLDEELKNMPEEEVEA